MWTVLNIMFGVKLSSSLAARNAHFNFIFKESISWLLQYLEFLYWSILKVFHVISKAVSKQYFLLLLALSLKVNLIDCAFLSVRLSHIFQYLVPIYYKDSPIMGKPGDPSKHLYFFRFKNGGPRSNSYFSSNLRERTCVSISPFLSHFFNS